MEHIRLAATLINCRPLKCQWVVSTGLGVREERIGREAISISKVTEVSSFSLHDLSLWVGGRVG